MHCTLTCGNMEMRKLCVTCGNSDARILIINYWFSQTSVFTCSITSSVWTLRLPLFSSSWNVVWLSLNSRHHCLADLHWLQQVHQLHTIRNEFHNFTTFRIEKSNHRVNFTTGRIVYCHSHHEPLPPERLLSKQLIANEAFDGIVYEQHDRCSRLLFVCTQLLLLQHAP